MITTFVAAVIGWSSADTTSRYTTRSTLYVGTTSIDFETGTGELSNDRNLALQNVALTFSKMIDSQPIALRTVQRLDLDITANYVVAATTTSQEPATQLIYVDVTDPDPALAQSLANGLADAFVEVVQEFEPGASEGAVPRLPAYVFERAQLPSVPLPSQQLQAVVLAMMFGLLVSVGTAFLLDYLDLSVRTAADVERRLELPVVGVIPSFGDAAPIGVWSSIRPGQGPGR